MFKARLAYPRVELPGEEIAKNDPADAKADVKADVKGWCISYLAGSAGS